MKSRTTEPLPLFPLEAEWGDNPTDIIPHVFEQVPILYENFTPVGMAENNHYRKATINLLKSNEGNFCCIFLSLSPTKTKNDGWWFMTLVCFQTLTDNKRLGIKTEVTVSE
jgi:hypothetical protein